MNTISIYNQSKDAIAQEEVWIRKAKRNPKEFAPIYDKYYLEIAKYILKRVGDQNVMDEIVSDVFAKAIEKLELFEPKGVPIGAWIFQIARNELQIHYRRTSKTRVVSADSLSMNVMMDEIEEDPKDLTPLIKAMQELKPEELELIELRFFEKRSFDEVSNLLDISLSNAKVKSHRILKKLKKIITSS